MSEPDDPMLGRTIADRYEILSHIGAGGMGAVYRARQVAMDREVAVKVLHREFLRDESSRKRFVREMKATSAISHPNTVTVYDYGTTDQGEAFLVMELLSGITLHKAVAGSGPMPTARVVHITKQMAQALANAHDKEIVHRDIKPENIMLLDSYGVPDWVKVLDFGIARIGETTGEFQRESLTATGTVLGTPSYMSPERAMGKPMDHRSDIYAVGVLMYVMATGRTPFESTEPMSVLFKHVSEPVPAVSAKTDEPHPAWMDALIRKLMAKDPEDRPDSLHEVVHFLEHQATLPPSEVDGANLGLEIDHDSATSVLSTMTGGQAGDTSQLKKPRTVIRPSSGYARRPTENRIPVTEATTSPSTLTEPEPDEQEAPEPVVEPIPKSVTEAVPGLSEDAPVEATPTTDLPIPAAPAPEATEALQFHAPPERPTLLRQRAKPEPEPEPPTSVAKMLAAVAIVVGAAVGTTFVITEMMSGGGLGVTQTTKPAASAGGVVSPPVRVGILHSMSGTMKDAEQPVVDAIKLAIEQINGDGGVLGRTIDAFTADGRSDAAQFANEAERLIATERVSVLFGCWTSAARKAVKTVVERHDHLLIYPVQYEGLETSNQIIYLGSAPNQQLLPAVKWAYGEQDARRFFLVGSDYVYSRAANAIIRDALKKMGAKVVGEEYIPLGDADVGDVIDQIARKKPDIILNTISGDTNVSFVRALNNEDDDVAEIRTISFSITEQELAQMDLAKLKGHYAAWSYFQSIPGERNEAFVLAFKAKYGAHRVVTDPMEAAYVGVYLWAQAVEKTRNARPANVRTAMRGASYAGPGGTLRIDPATGHAAKFARIGQIQRDGQFKLVYASVEPLTPEPFPASRTPKAWSAFLQRLYKGWGNQWAAPTSGE